MALLSAWSSNCFQWRGRGCRKGGPAPGEEEQRRGSQPGRGGGQRPHHQKEPGPRKLQDPAYCHHGDMGYSWAPVPKSHSAGCQHTLTLHKVSGGSLPKLGMLRTQHCLGEGVFHPSPAPGEGFRSCCGKGIQVCCFEAPWKTGNPASGAIKVQAQHLEGSPLGLLRNQIPSLGGKWSRSWHLVGCG